jgi:hypothetical protein
MTTEPEPPTVFDTSSDKGPEFDFTTLSQEDRRDIVSLTTNNPSASYVRADTLELSALGANAELHGTWNPEPTSTDPSNLASWSEVGEAGRTSHAQTVRRGYLFPLGHEATFVKFSHRVVDVDPKSHNNSSNPGHFPVAYLQVQTSIRVTQPLKRYPAPGQPFAFSDPADFGTTDWPFQSVRMITTVTPLLDENLHLVVPLLSQALWPTFNSGEDVMWNFVAVDLAGRDIHFSMPLVFVYGQDKVSDSASLSEFKGGTGSLSEKLIAGYTNQPRGTRTDPVHAYWSLLGGTPLQFAPTPDPIKTGSTTHPTLLVALGVASTTADHNAAPATFNRTVSEHTLEVTGQPNFYPTIGSARIRMHAAEILTGNAFTDTPGTAPEGVNPLPPTDVGGVEFGLYGPYVTDGTTNGPRSAAKHGPDSLPKTVGSVYANNAGSVYAQATNSPPLTLPGNTVGGIGTPNMGISGLSAVTGAVGGDLGHYAIHNAAQLSEYFPGASSASQAVAELLGGLKLNDILDSDNFAMPTISSQIIPGTGTIEVTYQLSTPLTQWPSDDATGPFGLTSPIFLPDSSDGALTLTTVVTAGQQLVGQPATPPSFTTNGSIDPFTIYLLGNGSLEFLLLHFESVTFTAGNGGKPTVTVNIDNTQFEGCLSFINMLSQYLQSLGLGGLTVNVEPTQVTVGASVSLPDVEMGYFDLTGVSFNASIVLPFINGPATATFAFSTSDAPFTITVYAFGGGGFVALSIGFSGIVSVQAQFEFTGMAALDLYVAAGSVTLYAGIYYSYTPANGQVTLTGFVRLTGQVQVLGIFTVTISCYIGLSYIVMPGQLIGNVSGTASLTIGVSVFGISKSFTFSVTKTFSGNLASNFGPLQPASRANELNSPDGGGSSTATTFANLMSQPEWTTYCNAYSI